MKKKLLFISIFSLLLTNCNNNSSLNPSENQSTPIQEVSSTTESVKVNDEMLISYKEELNNLLLSYYSSASIDFNEDSNFKQMYINATNKINESKNAIEAKEAYNASINEFNESFPFANGVIDYSNSTDKVSIYKAIEDYLIRNNLTKINILDSGDGSFSLNLNATNKQTWEYLFGEDGVVKKTPKEEYWEVEPALSNHFFVKAIDLAINKDDFSKIAGSYPDTSTFPSDFRVDVNLPTTYLEQTNQIKEYVFDIDEARKYFKLAMYELEASGEYSPGTAENPTVIELEIAWLYPHHETNFHNTIKQYLETAFNDESVSNGAYQLDVKFWVGEAWSDVYYNKLYCGKFDLAFGSISGSNLQRNDNFIQYLSSDPNISHDMTLNWSVDTNDASTTCIIYQNQKYSLDALYMALQETVATCDGNLTDPCEFTVLDYKENEDLTYTVIINLSLLEDFNIETKDIVIFYTEYSSYEDYYEESVLQNSTITFDDVDNTAKVTITISQELYDKYKGTFAIDIYYKLTYHNELYEQAYKSIYL